MALDTLADRELEAKKNKLNLSATELMVMAQRKSGRGAFKIGREFLRLQKGSGKLNLTEYVRYELYDDEKFTPDDKRRFLGAAVHWPLTYEVCDRTWEASTEDKWLANTILGSNGAPVPEVVAVIDRSGRNFAKTPKLTNADEVRSFLTNAPLPVFGKTLDGVASLGVFRVDNADQTHVHLTGHDPMDYDTFLHDHVGEHSYIIQRVVENHSFFDEFTDYCATVRMATLIRDDQVVIPFAILRVPGGGNIADPFWRPGNIVVDIDPETGEIKLVSTQSGIDLIRHQNHPVNDAPMVGRTLPMWDQMLEVTRSAAMMFSPVRYQSLDVAITPDGPVVVEINTGGSWEITQNASGKGFLTDEVHDAFRSWGSKLF